MRTPWFIACTLAAAVLGGYATMLVVGSGAREPDAEPEAPREARSVVRTPRRAIDTPARAHTPREPEPTMRARIAQTFAQEATPHIERGTVSHYLDDLEARARRQGDVTALEVETGMQALMAAGAPPEQQIAFAQRMEALATELRDEPPTAPPGLDRIESIADALRQTDDEDERAKLTRQYLGTVGHLDPAEARRAIRELDALVGAPNPGPSPTPETIHAG